jgi:hypothetical protein
MSELILVKPTRILIIRTQKFENEWQEIGHEN